MQEQSRSHYSTTSRAGSNAHRIEAQDDPFDISLDFDLPLPPSKRQKRDVPAAVGKQRLLSSPKLPSEFIVSRTPATTQPIESQLLGLDPPVTSDAFSHKARVEVIISTDPPESDGGESSSPRQPALIDLSLKTNTLLAEISANARPRQKTRGIPTAPQATTKQQSGGTRKQHADPDKCEAKERLKEQRRKEKEAETERRSVVKEAEKSRKRAEKEQKDAKKQEAAELAGANKARWDKNVSAAEMLVDLPASIEGKPLEREIRDVLKALNVDATTYTSILPNIVRFRRKITTSFNKELGYWEPVLEKIQEEKQAICLISGQHFLAMATAPDAQKEGVDAFMTMVKMQYADFKVTCLIDGLETAVKKGTKATRKAYSAAVRDQGQSEGSEQGPSRYDAGASISRQPGMSIEDKIEETLVALQVNHSCLVHQTGSSQETAEFIGSFTREMSTVPYRLVEEAPALKLISNVF